jgi:two-component system sensor histidine kinase KdpD
VQPTGYDEVMRRQVVVGLISIAAVAATTLILSSISALNHTTIALAYLLVVLFVAAAAPLWTAVAISIAAALCLNYFFLPPVGTLTLVDPANWVALFAFLVVSVVASQLSTSARARAQEARARRNAEVARERAELTSTLIASLSHDLRTPLTAIRTAVANLEQPSASDSQRQEQARVASEQLERLTRLFDEILNMARIDAGGVQPVRVWATPAEIVEAAVTHASFALTGRDVRVDAAEEIAVELDPSLTSAALAHVLENAARYAPEGEVTVRAWTDDKGLRMEVRDSGPGLKPAERERLFEPFYRGENLRSRVSGTGMGLAITRGLLAAQGGRVWADNGIAGGACFSIAVPARTRAVVQGS